MAGYAIMCREVSVKKIVLFLVSMLAVQASAKVFRALLDGPAESKVQPCISGVYPHLAMFNDEGECGTAAAAYWLWERWRDRPNR